MQRLPIRFPPAGVATLAALLALLLGACAGSGLKPGPGGMPASDMARVSLVVGQTRAQFPSLSGTELPYETRKPPEGPGAEPEPALFGTGAGVQRGIQTGERPRIRVELYLEKRNYAGGHARLTLADGSKERWDVVAFDQRGEADERFDFTYLLSDPEGRMRYLVVIGGSYESGGTRYHGYEGTLLVPGVGHDLQNWTRAYKVDFGYRYPVTPTYQSLVEQADSLFDKLDRNARDLKRLRSEEAGLAGDLAEARAQPATGEEAQQAQARRTDLEKQLGQVRARTKDLAAAMEQELLTYFGLRGQIADAYAAFVETNPYRWRDLEGKQAYYDAWKPVEFHHPRIDELVEAYLPAAPHPDRVREARTAAMAKVVQQNNWEKFPGERPKR